MADTNESEKGRKRRFRLASIFRFRLRTLLIVFTILGVFVGPELSRQLAQNRAVETLRSLPSTSLAYDYDLESVEEWRAKFPPIRSKVSGLIRKCTGSGFFCPVVRLFLGDDSAETIDLVGNLPNLKWLHIAASNGNLTNREIPSLNPIKNCQELEYLVIGNWLVLFPQGVEGYRGTGTTLAPYDVSNDDLKIIGDLLNMRILAIGGQFVTDESLLHLSKLTSLEYLYINKTKVTPEGIAELKRRLPTLEIVELGDTTADYAAEISARF